MMWLIALLIGVSCGDDSLDMSGTTECRNANGTYDVTWTVVNDGERGTFYGHGSATGYDWVEPGILTANELDQGVLPHSGAEATFTATGFFDVDGSESLSLGDVQWTESVTVERPELCGTD